MVTQYTNAEVLELFRKPDHYRDCFGLLITGGSRHERSTTADYILTHRRSAGQSCLSLTLFEVVAANHFGQDGRLLRDGVLLINELSELSQAEQVAIDVINPVFDVTLTLDYILTFTDEHPPQRDNPVAPAQRSPGADAKASTKHDPAGNPLRSFRGLLDHLATLTRNQIRFTGTNTEIPMLTAPTDDQRRAFTLIGTPIPLTAA